jgi:hypothetical protein
MTDSGYSALSVLATLFSTASLGRWPRLLHFAPSALEELNANLLCVSSRGR